MKINCISRSRIEYEDGIVSLDIVYEVDPDETVGSLMDRIVGFSDTGGDGVAQRCYNSASVVELRVAIPKPEGR